MLSEMFPHSYKKVMPRGLIFRDNNYQLGSPKVCDLRI
jgi:hypothetical protein